MASLRSQLLLEEQIREAGIMLLNPPADIRELTLLLMKVGCLLANVERMPSRSTKDALEPSMKALIADELLRHPYNDVRVFVASCISEIIRISAPDAPYSEELMKKIFQLFVATFENLSHKSGPCYRKALYILDTIAEVKLCLLMLDLECETLIIEIFRIVLKVIRWSHPYSLFTSMANIMILVIDESEDVSWDLLSTLLASVKKENQVVSPNSWKLGEKILTNCAAKLKPYLMEAVQSRGLALDEYSEIVTNVCNGGTVQFDLLNGIEQQFRDHLKSNAEHLMMSKAAAKLSSTDGTCSKETPRTGVKRKQTAGKQADSEKSGLGDQLVGSKVKVWWPLDKTFYEGVVDAYDHIETKHKILYDDGGEEILNLNEERWELIGDGILPGGGQETDVLKPDASSERLQKRERNTKFDIRMARNRSKGGSSLERLKKQETDMEFEPFIEICFALKALSPSKRAKASAIASKPKLRKSGGSSDGTTSDEPIIVDVSKEADVIVQQSPKVIMTTSEGGEESPGMDQPIGEYFNNLAAMRKDSKKGRSCNDVESVDQSTGDYFNNLVAMRKEAKFRKSGGKSDGTTSYEPIIVDVSEEADLRILQSPKVIMTGRR